MNAAPALLAACIALSLLAGCTGYPPGTIRPGDTVLVRYSAVDLETGETVVQNATATVVVGGPISSLGYDVPYALAGHRANDTVRVESRDDPGRSFSQTVETPRELTRVPESEFTVDREVFTGIVGEPAIGLEFDYTTDGKATVVGLNETHVVFLPLPDERAEFGLRLVFERAQGEIVIRIEPLADRPAFVIPQPIPGFLSQPGTYRVLGTAGDNVTFAYSPTQDRSLLDRDLAFEVTIVRVLPPAAGAAEVHSAPQLLRDPRRLHASAPDA